MSGGSGISGIGVNSGGNSPCGACKFLRRKCAPGCIFAPYFDSEQGTTHFAAVHKVFGASNVSKLLLTIPVHRRLDAVITICYEAQARLRDPVYGCVGHIFSLQQQVVNLQAELSYLHSHLTQMELPQPPPPPPPQSTSSAPPIFSIADLSSATATATATANMATNPTTYDLASLFDPLAQASWAMQQRALDPRQYMGSGAPSTIGVDIQAVAGDFPRRHGTPPSPPASTSNASPSLSLSK